MHIDSVISGIGPVYLIGAGGHARVVYDAMRRTGYVGTVEVRDDNPAFSGASFHDLQILVPSLPEDVSAGWRVHVAIGDNRVRAALTERACSIGAILVNVMHPHATIAKAARYGRGCFLAAQCVLAPDARLGVGCIVNHGAVVDHDCDIGDFVHIAPRATLGGDVRIGDGCLIGAGAVILPGCKIGAHAVIGAGAVVVKDVPAGVTFVGIPAKALR